MALVEMIMPKMGESITEGTVLHWLKKVGDRIEQDESVLEIATDKVDTEVPATHGGILQEILAQEGEVVPVGKTIALISTGGEAVSVPSPVTPQPEATPEVAALEEGIRSLAESNGANELPVPATGRFYSPLVLNIARQESIPMQELARIPGTGADNRVTKKDILHYLSTVSRPPSAVGNPPLVVSAPSTASHPPSAADDPAGERETKGKADSATNPSPGSDQAAGAISSPRGGLPQAVGQAKSLNGRSDIIEMDRMRKMIAQRMVDSKRISPHVTSFVEADVTNIVFWRNRIKEDFKRAEGENITFTPIFVEALVKAIRDYPMINVSVDGDKIIVKKDIHIGVAVALPTGNLIVPVVKHADQYNLVGLTKRVNDLARRARENKLTPDDLTDGTYTMSNVGTFGSVMGTPIIVQPQVAIMAFGAVQKKPAVIETPYGDTLGIRHRMFLSHSYDHRVVDGALGGMFVRKVADYLESFDDNRKLF
ncbi:MAG: 2-oxo acid dehydrogenase subunit E2 [Ferruginibacter sp.]|nr:2-oxo acid dehydrogenase subunit E2 [Cytophagales bacterium]